MSSKVEEGVQNSKLGDEENANVEECSEMSINFPTVLPHMDINEWIHDPRHREWSGGFTFVHCADPQFGLIEKYFEKRENPRWDAEIALTSAAIRKINRLSPKPKFVMVGGDMLDMRPGTPQETSLRCEQYDDFIGVWSELDSEIKLIFCCGNHDVGDEPTEEGIKLYHSQFGPDFYTFWLSGIKFSVLNSQYWKHSQNVKKYSQLHHQFIKNNFSEAGTETLRHSVVFQHIPFFTTDPNEEDVVYLNIDKKIRFELMDTLHDAGVNYVFCGHLHKNGGGIYRGIEEVVTNALGAPLGNDPSGFRIVNVEQNKISSIFIGLNEENESQ